MMNMRRRGDDVLFMHSGCDVKAREGGWAGIQRRDTTRNGAEEMFDIGLVSVDVRWSGGVFVLYEGGRDGRG